MEQLAYSRRFVSRQKDTLPPQPHDSKLESPCEPITPELARREHARLDALQKVVLGLTSTLELREVLQRVAEMAQSLSASAHAHIFLYDAEHDELNLTASHWATDQRQVTLKPRRMGITYSVAHTGTPEFIEDSMAHAAYANVPSETRPGALACLPLVKGQRVLGTLNLGYWQPYRFDAETRKFLDLIARHAAIAIENARLYADAKHHAEEMTQRVHELIVVNELSKCVNSLDLNAIFQCGLDLIVRNFQAAYCALGLYQSETQSVVVKAVEPADDPALGMAFSIAENSLLAKALVQQRPFRWKDAPRDTSPNPIVAYLRTRGTAKLFVTPMIVKESVMGFVAVDPGNREPTAEQVRLLQTIGNQIATALENARLYRVAIEKAKMEHEFQLARDLQAGLIPREPPQIDGWDIAAIWQPARIVSGDFYDFIPISHPANSGSQGLVIADVSDKGAPAALFMALVRSTLRTIVSSMPSPVECITHANRLICDDAASGMFATLCYAQLDPTTGELVYVNAGHNPPLLYRKDQAQPIELERTGIALGVETTREFHQRKVTLEPDDFILFYTDGVTDATNAQEQEFGEARLRRVIREQRHASAAQIIAQLDHALCEFVAGEPPFDDVTVVILKRI